MRDFFQVGLIRAGAAIGGMLLAVALARLGSLYVLGGFTTIQATVLVLSKLAEFGAGNSLIRESAQMTPANYEDHYSSLRFIWGGTATALSVCYCVIASVHYGLPVRVAAMAGVAIVLSTAAFVVAGHLKGCGHNVAATLLEPGAISALTAIGVLLVYPVLGAPTIFSTLIAYLLALGIAISIVSMVASTRVRFQMPNLQSLRTAASRGYSFWGSSIASTAAMYLPMILIGVMLNPEAVGIYRAAERFALLVSFGLIIVNVVYPRRFAGASATNGLAVLARRSCLTSAVPACAVAVALIGWTTAVGLPIGDASGMGRWVLVALIAGQIGNSLAGPVAYLLGMRGMASIVRNVAVVLLVSSVPLMVIAVQIAGLVGVAVVVALVMLVQNSILTLLVRRRLGFWMVPWPLTKEGGVERDLLAS